MIRLLLLLCAGLFLTFEFAGRDHGQQRFGLEQADAEAAAAPPAAEAAAQTVAAIDTADPAPRIVPVVFAGQQPLIATPKPAAIPAAQPATQEPMVVKYVTGRSVNVRSGPTTGAEVVSKLARGDAVLVVWMEDNGWARIRIEGDGVDGYISASFLSDDAH
jgi:uncharacterized protein YgiM (DUF1202 family)